MVERGAIAAGHDPRAGWPFPDLKGFVYFISGMLAGPVITACLMKLLMRAIPNSDVRTIFASCILVPLLAFPEGSGIYRLQGRAEVEMSARDVAHYRAAIARKEALEARLVTDPEVALRERWYVWKGGDDPHREILLESLKSTRVPYTPGLLANIYEKIPEAGPSLVSHPACDPEFLTSHWRDALAWALGGDDKTLIAIVGNPRTPLHLVEELQLLETLKAGKELQAAIDLRLHGADLVMTKGDRIRFTGDRGVMSIWAGSDLGRSYEWKGFNRDAFLEARTEVVAGVREVHFRGSTSWQSMPHDDTDSGEFREGRRKFTTMEEATGWLRLQSDNLPTVYRNDGLVVSCGRDAKRRKIMVEVWQILVNGNKPTVLPGSDDSKISPSSK